MASRAVCAEHEPAKPAGIIDCLMQEADLGEDEPASMFQDVTRKPLRPSTGR